MYMSSCVYMHAHVHIHVCVSSLKNTNEDLLHCYFIILMMHCMLLCIDLHILHVNFVFLNCCYYSIAYMIQIAFVFKEKPWVSVIRREKM